MGFFSKTLQAAMPKMIGNPITTAVAMVSVALSVVKGKKATKATKNKKKATVKKSKIISKKQKKQMEVMERVCQSAYGIYIRGVTTVAARYIGHPAVAIPASEMVKTMMEEAAPTVNYLVQLEAGSKKESNIKEEKKLRIDKHTSGRFEYLKGCTNGWYTGFTKAIRGEQVIDEKYTLENLFSGNLTVEDMPDLPEYMTMVGAVIGAKYKGLWNSAKGTYDGVVTLVTDPEKVLEVASDAILDFMEDPWENTKELAGNIRDSVVDAVWRSTPQEISEDAGEILGDVLTAVSTGGGGKAAASGAKIAGKKLLALGKTGVREFVEGLEDLGKIGEKNAVYVGATTGIENAAKNSFINRLMMMASEAGDEAKKLTGVVEGATSKADDIATIAGKTGSVTNTVTSTTGELIENAVIGTPIVEGTKNITKEIVEGTTEKTTLRTTEKTTLQMLEEATDNIATGSKVDDIVEAEMKASSKVDDVAGVGAKASSKVDDIAETGAKASSKADDVVEAGAKANFKVDDTAKSTSQTTARTVVKEDSGKGKGRGGNVETSPAVNETTVGEVKTTKADSNNIEKNKAPTNEQISEVGIREITHKRLSEKVKKIRNKFKELREERKESVSRKVAEYGNMAVAEVDIPGIPEEFIAHSSINTAKNKAAQYGNFSYESTIKNLESYVDAPMGIKGLTVEEMLKKEAVPRYNDAEAKILEDITSRIKDTPDIKGKINLYTEKACCQSCSNLILEFKNKFPNVELNIYTDNL